jgi:integrase
MEKVLKRIETEIALGTFSYRSFFPTSKFAARFDEQNSPYGLNVLEQQQTGEADYHRSNAGIARSSLTGVTFQQFSEDWLGVNELLWKRSYRKTVRTILNQHLLPAFGERDVGSLTRAEILKFRSTVAKLPGQNSETLSPRRINAIMTVLHKVLEEAADAHQFSTPFTGIKSLKVPRSDVQPFTLEEVRRILDTVREDFRDYYLVRFFTGLRTSEVDGLKWKYVLFDQRLILVRETLVAGEEETTKTEGSARDIQMSQLVFEALQRQFERTGKSGGYVFCNRAGQPLDYNNVTKRVWYPLLRLLDLKPRRPYQTRHTAATLWLGSGENPEWVARQLGHTSTEMLFRVYSRYVPNLTRQDGSAFERLLASHMNGAGTEAQP